MLSTSQLPAKYVLMSEHIMSEQISALLKRRSVLAKNLHAPGPSAEQLEQI